MRQAKTRRVVNGEESVSIAVVHAVADANGVEPAELDERLHDYVEPDALDRLFESGVGRESSWNGQLSFRMAGCHIEISGSGTVVVTPLSEETTTETVATH